MTSPAESAYSSLCIIPCDGSVPCPSADGHGTDPSHGIMHKDEYALSAGDVILAEEGDYVKVVNESDHDQLVYLRIFDKAGWRGRSPDLEKDPQS